MVKAALKNPHAVIVLALAILVIGLTAISKLPTDILPTFKTPAVQIVTFYPGMPAEVMEKDITTRLERWTGQSNGIARQEAKSMVGVSIVKDFFREDVDPNTAMSQVTSLAMSDLFYLPPGTIPPMVMPFDPTATIPLCLISVSSPQFDETKLYDVAYFDLRNRLQSITGVIAPAVYGGRLRRILAYVDPLKAQARGLSPLDVINAVRDFNVMIPTGNAKFGALDYQINANGMVPAVAQLNDLPLRVGNGPPTYIRDVAKVEDSHQIQTNIVRVEGKRQVYIPIYRQPGANTIAVVEGIKAQLKPILERIKGINLDVVMDQSFYVRESINNLVQEAALGFLLAAAMVFIFLRSVRPTGIVLMALPLAVLGSLIGLYFTSQTLNAMTLGGIAVVIGLLIDESIVVLESSVRLLELGRSPREAALIGASEVMRPLTIVTITISVVFFPIVFMGGIGKFLFLPLASAVIFAIWTSRLLASTFVPVCAAKFFKQREAQSGEGRESWFARVCWRPPLPCSSCRWLFSNSLARNFSRKAMPASLLSNSARPRGCVSRRPRISSRKSRRRLAQSSRKGNARWSSQISASCWIGLRRTRRTRDHRTRSFLCSSPSITRAPLFPTSMNCAKNCRSNFPASNSISTPAEC